MVKSCLPFEVRTEFLIIYMSFGFKELKLKSQPLTRGILQPNLCANILKEESVLRTTIKSHLSNTLYRPYADQS